MRTGVGLYSAMLFSGLVNMNFNRTFKTMLLTVFAVSALLLLSGCGSKKATGVNTKAASPTGDPAEKTESTSDTITPPPKPQELISSTDEYDKLPEDKKADYEAPVRPVKTKDKSIKTGDSVFSNLVFVGDGTNVKITGQLQLIDVEDISNEDRFDFELKGTVENNDRKILIKMRDVAHGKQHRIRLGAQVICLNYDEKNQVDCSEAVVFFAGKVKETEFRKQFETPKKPKVKKPAPPVVEEPPKDPTQPLPNPVQVPPKPVEEDHSHEGKEDSLKGTIETHLDDDIDELNEEEPKKEDPAQPAPPKKEKPKITKDGLLITPEGPRPLNQAVEYPDDGSLLQATDLALQQRQLKEEGFYNIVHADRKKYYATYEMGQMILKLGQFTSQNFKKRLAVGNLSLPKGGESPPHASHQNGTDGDFGYPTDEEDVWFPTVAKGGRLNADAYSATKTLDLLEKAFKNPDIPIERVFMDQLIIDDLCKVAKKQHYFDPASSDPKWTEKNEFWKNVFRNVQHIDGHGDHMHIRIKCTPQTQRLCSPKIYRKMNHCQS